MTRLKHYIQEEMLSEGINDSGIFKAVFMAGTPSSGKSYVISKISDGAIEPRIVNTDKMVEFLKAFKAEEWFDVEDTVKRTTKNQLSLYLNSMLPLFIDGTSSKPSSLLRRNGILKSLGYDTALIWVDTSLETSLERAKKRFEQGGREVEEKVIRKIYKELTGLKKYYSSEFKNFIEILNDDGELIDKVVLQAYKKMSSFFNSPIRNPLGIRTVENMKENGYKYLVDTDDMDMIYLKKLVSSWYRK